ncbi:MAG: tetratricopeptide repeat protein [Pseudomonadota bacterium]
MGFVCLTSCAIQPPGGYKPEQDLGQRLAQASQLRDKALLRYQAHDYERAAFLYQSVLEIVEESLGPRHLTVALAADDLAEVYRANGQYPDAAALYQRALDILDRSPPKEPQHLATVLNNLGLLYLDTGAYTRAEALISRALTLRRDSLEPDRASVALSMNNLALLYKTLGRYSDALAFYTQALDLQEGITPQSNRALAVTLGNLGALHLDLGHYSQANSLFQRALDLQEKNFGLAHPGLATPLNNLASLYHELGEYDEARMLYRRALSLHDKDGPTRDGLEASGLLSNLGSLHASLGDYTQAEEQFQRVLAIQRDHLSAQHPDIAETLGNLAWVYQMRGHYTEAEALYQQALDIRQQAFGPRHIKVARSLLSQGDLHLITGEFGRAEPLYQQARRLTEEVLGAHHPDVAIILNNLALLYRTLGDYARAERLYNQALDRFEMELGPNHSHVALTLNNMALLFYYQKDYARAEPLVRRALAIQERSFTPDHPDIAVNQVALARILLEKGAYDTAQQLLERALASQRQALGENHPRVAFSQNNLAKIHKARGESLTDVAKTDHEYALAKQLHYRALTIATSGGQPEILWRIQHNLSQLLTAQNNLNAAIFYGYEAVTTLRGLRKAVSSLDRELQQSFLQARYEVYRHLADLLISQGYIPEAQQVLGMLKQAEYFDFVRRSADEPLEDIAIDLEEVAMFSTYYRFRDDLVTRGRERAELGQAFELAPVEEDNIAKLDQILATAQERFLDYFSTLEMELLELRAKPPQFSLSQLQDEAISLMGLVRDLGPGWVLVHTLITEDELHLILTTPDTQLVRFSKVKAVDLHQTIRQFREALESGSDLEKTLNLAKQLYDWVLAPLASDLRQADARSIALSLDGSLRYLPIAALYDGMQYVAEIYNVVMYTETAKLHFKSRPSINWRVAGLGASKAPADVNLADLPAVKDEVNGIVKEEQEESDEGVLPGVVFFDEDFTERTLRRLLEMEKYSVLHIAGHFSVNAGSMRGCKLFLGDGNELTLEDIKKGRDYRFNFQKELVTLSACNTAVGGSVFGSGIEVESFGALAQKKGAESVLATLWPVSDSSTGLFMQLFYAYRERPNITKAEALRLAQLALLRGEWMESEGTLMRGVEVDYGTTANKHYRHPYYWAPFVLMGNAL